MIDMMRFRYIFKPHLVEISKQIYFSNELGIVHGTSRLFGFVARQRPPFVINDHRFGIVLNGEADINFNLVDRHVQAGTIVYLGPGTIITPIRFSNDLEIYGFPCLPTFPCRSRRGRCRRHLTVRCATPASGLTSRHPDRPTSP